MKKINKPYNAPQEEILNCFPRLQYKEIITKNSKNYIYFLDISNLKNLNSNESRTVTIDNNYKKKMLNTYKSFSNSDHISYEYYSTIRSNARVCPFCCIPTRTITQLDHFFPKSIYPSLAITVDNLVPICSDCNKNKDDYDPITNNGEIIIHPYFDYVDLIKNNLLTFICNEKFPVSFNYSINTNLPIGLRISEQFRLLKLFELYEVDFLTSYNSYLREIFDLLKDVNDYKSIKKCIERKRNSYSNIKPWLYVAYDTLLNSKWFFEEILKINCV